jgi:hypothetical protein
LRIECLDSRSGIKNLFGFRARNFQHSSLASGRVLFSSCGADPSRAKNGLSSPRPPLGAKAPKTGSLRLFTPETNANTPRTHCNILLAPHRPVVLPVSSLAAFGKSPGPRGSRIGPRTPPKRGSAAGTALRRNWVVGFQVNKFVPSAGSGRSAGSAQSGCKCANGRNCGIGQSTEIGTPRKKEQREDALAKKDVYLLPGSNRGPR